ncbi:hypothetical protein Leryth_014458 [Lithospermum erythrorhizon]|nr:hypothetical protein Leryth_014458 [Lithospermum erythrorhizon]
MSVAQCVHRPTRHQRLTNDETNSKPIERLGIHRNIVIFDTYQCEHRVGEPQSHGQEHELLQTSKARMGQNVDICVVALFRHRGVE